MFRILSLCLVAAAAGAEPATISLTPQELPAPIEVTARELWRVGAADDDLLLGVVVGALVDPDGNVYLLDSQLSEIQVFDAEGIHVRTIGREGEGPGEFRRAGGMFFVGENLCVAQRFPGRLVLLTLDGEPAGDFQVEGVAGMGGVQIGQSAGDKLVFSRASGRRDGDAFVMLRTLASHDARGKQLAVLGEAERRVSPTDTMIREGEMQQYEDNWALLADGRVAIGADPDHYDLAFHEIDGSPVARVRVEHPLLARTAAEKEQMRAGFAMFGGPRGRGGRGNANAPQVELRDQHPVFAKLDRGPDGKLWVLTARGARPSAKGVLAQFDVFESNGQLARRVLLRAEGSATEDGIFFGPDRMILVRGYRDALRAQFGQAAVDEAEPELESEPIEIVVYGVSGR
jgi:hypothetical protein